LANKKKVTKIIHEIGINYTFLKTMSTDTKPESKNDASNTDSNVEKDVLKKRSIDSNSKSNFNLLSYSNRVLAIDLQYHIGLATQNLDDY
jgi:hypothetical protein